MTTHSQNFAGRHASLMEQGWATIAGTAGPALISDAAVYCGRYEKNLAFLCGTCSNVFTTSSFLWQRSADGKRCGSCKMKHHVVDAASRDVFIARCRTIHGDKFNYDQLPISFSKKEEITVTCNQHGDFATSAYVHVNGAGCLNCSLAATAPVKAICEALEQRGVECVREAPLEVQGQGQRRRLRFDIWLPTLATAIEYDGPHHTQPIRYCGISQEVAHRNFGRQQLNDQIKNAYCEERGIRLVRIPYTVKDPAAAAVRALEGSL